MDNLSKISLSDIKAKLNNKIANVDFFREIDKYIYNSYTSIGYYYQKFSSFNYEFCLQVLSGKKIKYIIL